jgi:hypothetical protein
MERYPKPLSVVKLLILNDFFCDAEVVDAILKGWACL